jgi:hypothetical protein
VDLGRELECNSTTVSRRISWFHDRIRQLLDEGKSALIRENPDLHTAPDRVERPCDPASVQEGNRDAACASESDMGPQD